MIKLYRGLAVTGAQRRMIINNPTEALGNAPANVRASMFDFRPVMELALNEPASFIGFHEMVKTPVTYGTTDPGTATMYALERAREKRKKTKEEITPLIVSFKVSQSQLFVDPNDFPVDVFISPRKSDDIEAQKVERMRDLFGTNFAELYEANRSGIWEHRRVIGHAICFSSEMIRHHLDSKYALRGRNGIVYVNAFGVFLPVQDVVVENLHKQPNTLEIFPIGRFF